MSSGPASKARGVSAGPEVKTERNFGTGPGRPRIKEVLTALRARVRAQATSSKLQATSSKLDKLQAVGYYRIRKRGHMNSKEIKWTIDRLDDGDWQRMKEHMDKKFPNMKLDNMKSFQALVRLFGKYEEHKAKLN